MTIGGLNAAVSSCRACRFASSTSRRTTRSTRTTSRVSDAHAPAHPHAHPHVRTNTPSPHLLHVLSSAQRHHCDNHQHPPIPPSPRYTAALLLLSTIGTLHPSTPPQTPSHTHEQSLFSYTLHCSTSFQTRSGSSRSLGTATATTTTSSRCVVPCRFLHCFQVPANTAVEIPCQNC
jgi:hypothetical protein